MTDEKLAPIIPCHCWNKDGKMIALSPNNEEIHIYSTKGSSDVKTWERKYVLKEHGGWVSGIDWCHQSNVIVSCGHDRNAYVWKYEAKSDTWKPTLVILRISRAATCVKWSPLGNKFAVGSGAKCVPICHFEQSNDWWISKMIKKHKSTVLSLAWCCNNKFIVTGSCDGKCRIFSAYIEGIDAAEDDGFGEVWANQHNFGEVLAEFDQGKSWVNAVAWSPNGFRVAFAGHGSSVHFVQILAGSAPHVQTITSKTLPFVDCAFVNDNTLVAVGFDLTPTTYEVTGGSEAEPVWSLGQTLDKEEGKAAPAAKAGNAFGSAFKTFQDSASRGIQQGQHQKPPALEARVEKKTRHTNLVNEIWAVRDADGNATKIWTSGFDGRILCWDLKALGVCK